MYRLMWLPFLLSLTFDFVCNAQNAESCSDSKIIIYFGNGMHNSLWNTQRSRDILQNRIQNSLKKNLGPNFLARVDDFQELKIAYNLTKGPFLDILRSRDQKNEEIGGNLWRYLSNLDTAPQWFQKMTAEIALQYDRIRYL